MVTLDGKSDIRVTTSPDSETSPRWSPDGQLLAFLSSRPGKTRGNQVWIIDRRGGEAQQLTDVKGRLQGYEWSPDSRHLALVIGDADPDAPPEGEAAANPGRGGRAPKPIVIDRYHYKQDGAGEAGIDYAIRAGIADPARLGVGGWSYGGILTDYMIASDTRFNAATSGA